MKRLLISVFILMLVFSGIMSAFASSFVDVADDAYYASAAARMAERGILSGYGDGYYYGSHHVTRAQIAALACKMLGKADEAAALAGKTAFADISEDSWCTGYVNYAAANGIISGDGDGNFRPDDSVKYEEVVKVVVCVLGLDSGIKIDPSDWSKEYLEVADKAGLTKNLIGKKGEAMVRSDIAVICDAGMSVLDAKSEQSAETTTTKKSVTGVSGNKTDTPEVTTTTEETTKAPANTTRENELPPIFFN